MKNFVVKTAQFHFRVKGLRYNSGVKVPLIDPRVKFSDINMSDLSELSQVCLQKGGLYIAQSQDEECFAPRYAIEVTDDAGVSFLRRLLTVDAKTIGRGHVKQGFILNALGAVTDFAWVAHLPDSDTHYRVVFESPETLAWMHQVAKAFDEEFVTIQTRVALIFGQATPAALEGKMPADGSIVEVSVNESALMLMRCGAVTLVTGDELALGSLSQGVESLDEMAANTLGILAGLPQSMDWMNGETTPDMLAGEPFVDFSDASRMFIGRALTEARMKAAGCLQNALVGSHADNAEIWFEDPQPIIMLNTDGVQKARVQRAGELNGHLVMRVALPASEDASKLVTLFNENDSEAWGLDVIHLQ